MPSKLLIVESPAKAKTLSRYLGPDFTIKASMGHIRDLPGKELAVDVEKNFKPKYTIIPAKKKTVDDLRKAAKKVDEILLATDPDREGEAIAWHIAYILGDASPIRRVMFNEITKKAVREAVENSGEIDLNKVDAQQARRVLDRLVGYQVSQQLWGVIAKGLSAGRVQSVALRLIVEREEEIEAFNPEEYWNISGLANIEETPPFHIKLVKVCGDDVRINNGETAKKVLAELKSKKADLNEIRRRTSNQKPHPPFITSTLQQEAAKRLRMGVKRTMSVAQKLYEGIELGKAGAVGLITYMRTDSTRVSDVAITAAREYIAGQYGEAFLSPKPRNFTQKKKRTQDAHEAVRPTSMEWSPEKAKPFLSREQHRLYELIWNRFMATQMADAKYEGVTVDIGVGDEGEAAADIPGVKGKRPYILRAVGRKLKFAGFRRLWGEGEKEESDDKKAEISSDLPELFFAGSKKVPSTGDAVNITEVDGEQKFTQPPARFSESMLVKTLDEQGVGRPSTYAQIISTIQDRKYVERDEKRRLAPTELGRTVNKILVSEFEDVFNVAFTAKMEEALDSVEDGKKWTDIVKKFWTPFNKRIEEFKGRKKEIKEKSMTDTGRTCPECKEGNLVERWGRYGKFISCNRYPECKYIEKTNGNGEKAEPEKTGKECPTCKEGELLIRQGRNGKFVGCSRYPKCRHTEPLPGEEGKKKASNLPDVNIPCPREGCGGTIVAKRTRRGKLFFSCTNWKEKSCKVAFWDMPIQKPCPECNYPLITIKGKNLVCPECKHKEVNEEGTDAK